MDAEEENRTSVFASQNTLYSHSGANPKKETNSGFKPREEFATDHAVNSSQDPHYESVRSRMFVDSCPLAGYFPLFPFSLILFFVVALVLDP